MTRTIAVIVMGVSGSGKSTLGGALAGRLGTRFVDADSLHSEANVAKMAAGVSLSDRDRGPWLHAVADELVAGNVVIACSALKRGHRDRLRAAAPALALVFLHGDELLLGERMRKRANHFMPTSLLASQLSALEPPTPDEHPIEADANLPVEVLVDHVARRLAMITPHNPTTETST